MKQQKYHKKEYKMIKRRRWAICLSVVLFSCHQNNIVNPAFILIDGNQKFPELVLKLSDIADISYIPLSTKDTIFGYSYGPIFVYGDKIFIGDNIESDPKLLVYDRTGILVNVFGSSGRGPGEFMGVNGLVVDTMANELTLYDNRLKKIIVYSTDGRFKREKNFGEIYEKQSLFDAIEIINDDYLLVYFGRSMSVVSEDIAFLRKGQVLSTGKTFIIVDKQTLTEVPFDFFDYEKPADFNVFTLKNYLTTTKDGVYITNERSDTIFFMNRDLEVIPKFIDITDYGSVHKARLFPAIETDRYIFFSTERGIKQGLPEVRVINTIPRKFFAYDKKLEKLFRLNNGLSETVESGDEAVSILNNQVVLTESTLTRNHNYASKFLWPEFLHEHYNQLPEELKEITKKLKEDDNPVLMLIKFK